LCSGCHVKDKVRYNTTLRPQAPPTICVNNIGNNTSWDNTDQSWYNHSEISDFNDNGCKGCHGSLLSTTLTTTTTEFVHKVGVGGGKYCVKCHDISRSIDLDLRIDVQAMNKSDAIHYDLNRAAIGKMNKNESPDNVRCWACHGEGDGSDAAQPEGHPDRVLNKNPRDCSDMDCHNVNQSFFNEPMVYEHFKYADRLDNPGNVLTSNISTVVGCEACHINSIVDDVNKSNIVLKNSTSKVSHYGSTDELMAYSNHIMTDCVYCHEDEDNAEEWGDAIDPMDREVEMIDEAEDKTMHAGDLWELRNGYIFEVTAFDLDGDNAHVRLSRHGELLDEQIIYMESPYEYEATVTDDGKTFDRTTVLLNLTGIMSYELDGVDELGGVALFEGRTIKRIHKETTNSACYACHMEGYAKNHRYTIVGTSGNDTYYTKMLIDFDYYEDNKSKTLRSGEEWNLGDGFVLTTTDISIKGRLARVELVRNGVVVEDDIMHADEMFEYETDIYPFNDLCIFRANVSGIFRSENDDLIVLRDVRLISPDISEVDDEDYDDFRLDGYNISWIAVGEDFGGKEPFTLHVPPLTDGWDMTFADCVRCHDIGNDMEIKQVDAIASQLGAHAKLNENASNDTILSDPIDKACWACHGIGMEPDVHPDKKPKECVDCHVHEVLYGAVTLIDEAHSQAEDCSRCHAADYPGLHVINVFEPNRPHIIEINMVPEVIRSGQLVNVSGTVISGWNMKVEAIEYFIGAEGTAGTGTAVVPSDGIFDEQIEEFEFAINTNGLESGNHAMYIHAMERGEWGQMNKVVFTIVTTEFPESAMKERRLPMVYVVAAAAIIIGIAAWLLTLLRKRGYLFCWNKVPGDDNERLIRYLKEDRDIGWVELAEIRKSDDGKTIRLHTNENSVEIMIDETGKKAILKTDDGRTHDLNIKTKNDKLNIFEGR